MQDRVSRTQSAPSPTTPGSISSIRRGVTSPGGARFHSLRNNISERIGERVSSPRRKAAPRATNLLVRTTSLFSSTIMETPAFFFPRLFRPSTYTCQICLDTLNADEDEGYDPYVLENCVHIFCKGCLHSYVKSKVVDGVVALTCCHIKDSVLPPSTCVAALSERDIKTILLSQDGGEAIFDKYARFKFDKENEHSRRCPTCDTAQINHSGLKLNGEINDPNMTCVQCADEYCYYHSNSHVGISCEEYERKQEDVDRQNLDFINQFSKPCPQCKVLVSKSGGCNQMKCTKCGCHFCWLCNKKVDSGTFPTHYQWWNLNGCPNMQMNESIAPSKGEVFRSKCLAILQLIFLSVPSLALSILSSILCCFCLDLVGETKVERFENCMSLWGNTLTVLVAIPFAIGAVVLFMGLFPVWCILYSIYATLLALFCPSYMPRRSTLLDGRRGSKGSEGRASDDSLKKSNGLDESEISIDLEMGSNFSPGIG